MSCNTCTVLCNLDITRIVTGCEQNQHQGFDLLIIDANSNVKFGMKNLLNLLCTYILQKWMELASSLYQCIMDSLHCRQTTEWNTLRRCWKQATQSSCKTIPNIVTPSLTIQECLWTCDGMLLLYRIYYVASLKNLHYRRYDSAGCSLRYVPLRYLHGYFPPSPERKK